MQEEKLPLPYEQSLVANQNCGWWHTSVENWVSCANMAYFIFKVAFIFSAMKCFFCRPSPHLGQPKLLLKSGLLHNIVYNLRHHTLALPLRVRAVMKKLYLLVTCTGSFWRILKCPYSSCLQNPLRSGELVNESSATSYAQLFFLERKPGSPWENHIDFLFLQ